MDWSTWDRSILSLISFLSVTLADITWECEQALESDTNSLVASHEECDRKCHLATKWKVPDLPCVNLCLLSAKGMINDKTKEFLLDKYLQYMKFYPVFVVGKLNSEIPKCAKSYAPHSTPKQNEKFLSCIENTVIGACQESQTAAFIARDQKRGKEVHYTYIGKSSVTDFNGHLKGSMEPTHGERRHHKASSRTGGSNRRKHKVPWSKWSRHKGKAGKHSRGLAGIEKDDQLETEIEESLEDGASKTVQEVESIVIPILDSDEGEIPGKLDGTGELNRSVDRSKGKTLGRLRSAARAAPTKFRKGSQIRKPGPVTRRPRKSTTTTTTRITKSPPTPKLGRSVKAITTQTSKKLGRNGKKISKKSNNLGKKLPKARAARPKKPH